MPWSVGDVDRHNKGLSAKQKRQWVAVANEVLKRTGSDSRAIRAANSAVREAVEGWDVRSAMSAEMYDRSLEAEAMAVVAEASDDDDHFYGAWRRGGSMSGSAMARARASQRRAARKRAATRARKAEAEKSTTPGAQRWKDHDSIVKDMEAKYPGSEWGDIRKITDIETASGCADAIDQLSTRFGPSPAFKGVRVRKGKAGTYAEVKRVDPKVKGSAVYMYSDYFGDRAGTVNAWKNDLSDPLSHVSSKAKDHVDWARSVVVHEMGHQYLGMNHYLRLGPNRHAAVRKAMQPYVNDLMQNYSKAHISKYARRPGGHEAWAEVFTAAAGFGADNASAKGETWVTDLKSLLDEWYPPGTSAPPDRAAGTAETGIGSIIEAEAWDEPDLRLCGWAKAHPEVSRHY